MKLFTTDTTALDLYALFRDVQTGEIYNTDAEDFEAFNPANYEDYAVAAVEQGTMGTYSVDVPTLPAGLYDLEFREQDGASPAQSDRFVDAGRFEWTGASFARLQPILEKMPLLSAEVDFILRPAVQDGGIIELVAGDSYSIDGENAIVLNVPVEERNLTGWTAVFGMKKLVSKDGVETFNVQATIEDAGGDNQRLVAELTKAQTATLATDRLPITPNSHPSGRAYRFAFGIFKDDDCVTLAKGEASVREKVHACELP